MVRRALVSRWREWNTPSDPLYQSADLYTATKRAAYSNGAATPDVWGWGLYATLSVDMTVPSDSDLAFTVEWAVIREDNSIVTIERTYSPVTFLTGRSTKQIDLLFPVEFGRPFYAERVDAIRITGLLAGNSTVHSMQLVAVEQAYLKVSDVTASPSLSGRFGGITIAQDGQMCIAHWGRDPRSTVTDVDQDGYLDHEKDHQNGVMGYGATVTSVQVTDNMGGAIGQLLAAGTNSLADVFTEANRMEGLTATYDDTAIAAAMTDGTNSIATRQAKWLTPVLPHVRVTAGAAQTLTARLVVTDVALASGRSTAQMRFFQRQRLGAVLEMLGVDASENRAAAGATITAKRFTGAGPTGSDATWATGTTDASGFATVTARNGQVLEGGVRTDFTLYAVGS
jgi:hypothetical protein